MAGLCGETALYIHVPFCERKCRYCGFYSEPIERYEAGPLVDALVGEMGRYQLGSNIRTAYIGGGSPSILPRERLLELVGEVVRRSPSVEEFTVEVNPGQVDEEILSKLRQAGVDRLSIGAQSFNQSELEFLGRRHSAEDIKRAVSAARAAGFGNISLDLIFAIPNSTLQSCEYSLRSAIEFGVEHISAYSLTYEEETPLEKAREAGEVVAIDEETDLAMYETAIAKLEKAGFAQYEISNFAKAGFECRHNMFYWANKPYIGVGPAAASWWAGRRTINIADIGKYIQLVQSGESTIVESEEPGEIEAACETAVLNLRRRSGIDLGEFKEQTGFDALELFADVIAANERLGLIERDEGRVYLTRKALPIADSVLCDFAGI